MSLRRRFGQEQPPVAWGTEAVDDTARQKRLDERHGSMPRMTQSQTLGRRRGEAETGRANSRRMTSTVQAGNLREQGFVTATTTAERNIPVYDAAADPYCPRAHTEKFKRIRQRMRRLEQPQEDSKSASKGQATQPKPRRSTKPRPERPEPAVSFQSPETTNPEAELDVVKAVLLREGYIQRLQQLIKRPAASVAPELVDLLDLYRLSSVEVVEQIGKWRQAQVSFHFL